MYIFRSHKKDTTYFCHNLLCFSKFHFIKPYYFPSRLPRFFPHADPTKPLLPLFIAQTLRAASKIIALHLLNFSLGAAGPVGRARERHTHEQAGSASHRAPAEQTSDRALFGLLDCSARGRSPEKYRRAARRAKELRRRHYGDCGPPPSIGREADFFPGAPE